MNLFKHLLITRFNLKKEGWDFTKSNNAIRDKDWLNDRIQLFEKFCFPSVKAQKNKNFLWLIFLDVDTPKKFIDTLEVFKSEFRNIRFVYINSLNVLGESIKYFISKNVTEPYVITSRLDNDDSLSEDYIQEIQNQFDEQEFCAIDFLDGYTLLDSGKGFLLGKKKHSFNPFISLIEKNENPLTVFHFDHAHWKKVSAVKRIKNKRVWLSVIHENNKVNQYNGYGHVSKEILRGFNMDLDERNLSEKKVNQKVKDFFFFLEANTNLFIKDVKRNLRLMLKDGEGSNFDRYN